MFFRKTVSDSQWLMILFINVNNLMERLDTDFSLKCDFNKFFIY